MLLGKFVAALAAALMFLAAPALAQADDPENTLLLQLEGRHGHDQAPARSCAEPCRAAEGRWRAKGFYDGVVFHRVIDGFMAQTGDPTGTGSGGSDLPDLKAEFTDTPFGRGVIGMARTQRSGQRQLAVLHHVRRSADTLNGQYTVLGEVVSGMEFVDAIKKGAAGATTASSTDPDKIVSMKVAADAQ